ncbi:MAG: helix-turn-helix transcriptional regulator [Cyanobacteria bacterium P01_E01_bin.6]
MEIKITMQVLRANAGLTAQQVAQELGVAESSVRNWDKGRTEPTLRLEQIKQLTQLYGCTLDDLIDAVKNSKSELDD